MVRIFKITKYYDCFHSIFATRCSGIDVVLASNRYENLHRFYKKKSNKTVHNVMSKIRISVIIHDNMLYSLSVHICCT